MKSIALGITFILHSLGLWGHTDPIARGHLAGQAFGTTSISSPSQITKTTVTTAIPVKRREIPLDLTASHILAVDAATMIPLYTKDPGAKVPIASITKTITVLTILQRHSLDEMVTIKKLPDYGPQDETVGLVTGDTLTVRQLVQAALIQSGNDAADALAIWDAGSATKFTGRMNAAVAGWGITDSHFASASGLQDTNNVTTASDLARIGKLILTNQFVSDTVKTPSADITSHQNRSYHLQNTNTLLENGSLYGIKTGYTAAAGECLLGITNIGGHPVITVILGASDRFGDTVRLINWIGSSYQWL